MSLPGLTFTRNKANTGRWSEVLITGHDEYLTAWMSSLYRLRNTTRSWEAEKKGETDGNSLCTSTLERSTGSRETNPFIYHTPLSEIKCLGLGHINEECVSDPNSSSVPNSEQMGEHTGTGCTAGKTRLAACAKLSLRSRIQTSSTCPLALKQQISARLRIPFGGRREAEQPFRTRCSETILTV